MAKREILTGYSEDGFIGVDIKKSTTVEVLDVVMATILAVNQDRFKILEYIKHTFETDLGRFEAISEKDNLKN